jgi:putative toxin-antitoxin system antitoxin component (TIGR02293 family)
MYDSSLDNPSANEALVNYESKQSKYSQLVAIIGGKKALKKDINNEMDLVAVTRVGLPKKSLDTLAKKLGISMERMSALLHISHRTIQRKSPSDHLSVHVSEQILSIAEVVRKGLEVFEDDETELEEWLHGPISALDYKKPIDLMDTTFGTRILIRILGRIEHGVY